jgi:hypothetical protein
MVEMRLLLDEKMHFTSAWRGCGRPPAAVCHSGKVGAAVLR